MSIIEYRIYYKGREVGRFEIELSSALAMDLESRCEGVEDDVEIDEICDEFGGEVWDALVGRAEIEIISYVE